MSDVMNRPWSFSENSVASYSMLIGGTWTASIHDKRTHSSMYSFNFTKFCNSGKSYKVLHSCLLTSFKAKKKRNVRNLLMKLFAAFLRMYEMMGLKQCHVVSRKENSWLNAARVPLAKLFIPSTKNTTFLSQKKCIDWVYISRISLIIAWRCLRRHCFKYHKTIYTLKSSLNNQLFP